jgi:hypothetical protein
MPAHCGPIGDAGDGEIRLVSEFHSLAGVGLCALCRGLRKGVVRYSRQERDGEYRPNKSAN